MKTSFVHSAKTFLRKLINQRKRLLTLGSSFKNELAVRKALERMEQEVQRNFTDRGMAVFFSKHSNQIEILITGPNSRSHNSHREQFHQLLSHARIIAELGTIKNEHEFEMNLN